MKIIRRSLTLILTLAVLLAGFSFPEPQGNAVAETVVPSGISGTNDVGEQPNELLQSGEWLYYLYEDEAIIAGYLNKAAKSLTIPYRLDKCNVTGIASNAFNDNPNLNNIEIHSLITRISNEAFLNTKGLKISAYSGSYAIKFAMDHSIGFNNLTNPIGAFYVKESVIDLLGFPKNSIKYGNNSISVSKKIAECCTIGDCIVSRVESSYNNLVVLKIQDIVNNDGKYYFQVEYLESPDNIIEKIDFRVDDFSVDPNSIEMLVECEDISVVSSSSIPIRGKTLRDSLSLKGTWHFTDWFSVSGTVDTSFDAFRRGTNSV